MERFRIMEMCVVLIISKLAVSQWLRYSLELWYVNCLRYSIRKISKR
jgi:hypothetical protein